MRTCVEWYILHSNMDLTRASLPTRSKIRVDPIHLLQCNPPPPPPIEIVVITIIIWTLEMTKTRWMPKWESKIIIDISCFCCAPRMPIAHLIHVICRPSIRTWHSHSHMGNSNNMLPSKGDSKYLIPWTSMLSKLKVVRSNLDILLNFVGFNASTIFKLEGHERGWRGV